MSNNRIVTNKEKRCTSIEEVIELKNWFDAHQDRLPETLQIDASAYTPDLKSTIEMLFEQADICYDNPKMQGCIILLRKIRKLLEKE